MAGRKRLIRLGIGGLIAGLLAVLVIRPWEDSVMTVAVTVVTDGASPRLVYRASHLLAEEAEILPVLRAELDLAQWAGKLVRLDVEGEVRRRGMAESSTGFVACEAELATPQATTPIEFISWQQGHEIGMHTAPLGPVAFRLDPTGKDRFAFAITGSLWHCLKVPASARLRFRLKPVLTSALGGSLEPYVASRRDRRVEEWMGEEARTAVRLLDSSTPRKAPPPDVFIYVIDALRADHLGCYGYTRGTSPAIDAFAAEATLYQNAQTAVTWTRPSVATMLTGLYPSVHGAMHWSDGLAQWPVLLPEMLHTAGYDTRGFVTTPNLSVPFGLDQGYDHYVYCNAPSAWVNQMVAESLRAEDASAPAFMYLHTVEPHDPYLPTPEHLRQFDRGFTGRYDGSCNSLEPLRVPYPDVTDTDANHLMDLYDAEIYEADRGFAGFLETLKRAGRYDNSLVILAADHGEGFMEHDTLFHAWNLNQELTHVPLIIRFPGGRHSGLRIEQRVSLVDVAPTVLAQAGVAPDLPYDLPGADLEKYASQQSLRSRPIFMEVSRWEGNDIDLVAVIDEDGFKRVADVSVPPHETATRSSLGLWDTRADPRERVDLSRKLPVRAAYGEQLIAGWLLQQRYWRGKSPSPRPPQVNYDEALERHLRALGYLGGAPPKGGRSNQR